MIQIYIRLISLETEETKEVFDLCDVRSELYNKLNREKFYLSKCIDNQVIKLKRVDKHDNMKLILLKTPPFLKLTSTKANYLKKYLNNTKVIRTLIIKNSKGKSGYMVESPTLINCIERYLIVKINFQVI